MWTTVDDVLMKLRRSRHGEVGCGGDSGDGGDDHEACAVIEEGREELGIPQGKV